MKRRRAKVEEPLVLDKDKDEYLDHLVAKLEIDMDDLELMLAHQPELFYRAARELARHASIQEAAAKKVSDVRARIVTILKRTAEGQGTVVSDDEAWGQVASHSDYVNASEKLRRANSKARQARAIYRSYKHRAWMLNLLVKLKGMS